MRITAACAILHAVFRLGPVAQLDRASDYESEGCRFDSCQARHFGECQIAGWSSLVARQAHNLKVVGSNPAPATNLVLAGDAEKASFSVLGRAYWRRADGHIGTWPLRVVSALAKTNKTPKTPRNALTWYFALGTALIWTMAQRASLSLARKPFTSAQAISWPASLSLARKPFPWPASLSLARKPTLPPSWVSWVSWVSWPARQKMKSLAGAPPTPSGTTYGTPPLTGNAAILAAHYRVHRHDQFRASE